MPFVPAFANATRAALRGRMSVAGPLVIGATNNNRNNASLPRAGD
ncbi:hypothetical protein J2X06_001219 [Lysobacter niastensis]|uniref:Uncharacterized protein n=1 Tax=Lysobacter niastensis TaxID=380629 RepID=A0ABU1W9N3_9GAMM|nr:hypothetical protein [Lysobacter niastensis]MDR7134035.1 hypothetical protein [Lysobacter niastensis]